MCVPQTSTAGSEPSPWACRASSLFILGFSVRVCHTSTYNANAQNNLKKCRNTEKRPHAGSGVWKITHFRAVVCFGFQFAHGDQSFQEAAFQKAHRSLAVETSVRIGQDQFEGNGEARHVHGEGPAGTPAGVEADHLGRIFYAGVKTAKREKRRFALSSSNRPFLLPPRGSRISSLRQAPQATPTLAGCSSSKKKTKNKNSFFPHTNTFIYANPTSSNICRL